MTRHNAGFMAVDALCAKAAISLKKPWLRAYSAGEGRYAGERICAAKSFAFMNNSGEVLPRILSRLGLEPANLLVLCDTMDLPPGALRLKTRGSSAGQKGLASIIRVLGTECFMRVYIGVGRPAAGEDVVAHVLGAPDEEDAAALARAVDRAAQAALSLLTVPPEGVMNEINSR
ncbi:MAG: aminoacyl-tRNA hydrolase [Spirochaetaceae bacterium]|nr:aminoacyl-tRNA hydrolase [Spirochaetaceae bacterium]